MGTERGSVGGVLGRAKTIVRLHGVGFFAVAFVVVFVPSLWGDRLSDAIEVALVPDRPGKPVDDLTDFVRTIIELIPDLLCLAGTLLLAAVVVDAAAADARGTPRTFPASLRVGLAHFPINLVIAVLGGLAVALGGLVLIVPGVKIVTAWSLAVPVFVAERPRVVDAFHRSRMLTTRHRWPIAGLIGMGIAAAYLSDILENDVSDWLRLGDIGTWIFSVAGASLQTMLGVLATTIWAATYLELRWIKEGSAAAAMLAAFD